MVLQGTWAVENIECSSLVGNACGDPSVRPLPIYLPPGYSASPHKRYPVVYFLHAFTSSALSWNTPYAFTKNVVERFEGLIASEKVPPCIGVFPDGWTRFGGGQWLNSEGAGAYADIVTRDIVSWVDSNLRTAARKESRAVVGKSSGGFGALNFGRSSSDIFGHVGCLSGDMGFEYCYLSEFPKVAGALIKAGGIEKWWGGFQKRSADVGLRGDDHSVINILAMASCYSPRHGVPLNIELPFEEVTARLREDIWLKWLTFDPTRWAAAAPGGLADLKSLFIDCGTRDEFHLRWGARMLHESLEKAQVPHVYEEFEDGHRGTNYRYERALEHLCLRFDI